MYSIFYLYTKIETNYLSNILDIITYNLNMSNIYILYTDACKKGNIDKAKQIIDENKFILHNDGGDFALSWALYYNHIELLEYLLTIDHYIDL